MAIKRVYRRPIHQIQKRILHATHRVQDEGLEPSFVLRLDDPPASVTNEQNNDVSDARPYSVPHEQHGKEESE